MSKEEIQLELDRARLTADGTVQNGTPILMGQKWCPACSADHQPECRRCPKCGSGWGKIS
jgi:hypothetical protein